MPKFRAGYFLLVAVLLLILVKAIHFNGLYGQDAHEYLRYARELKSGGIAAGLNSYYPPLYSALGYFYSFSSDPLFPLQAISIISFSLTLVTLAYIVKLISPGAKYTGVFLFCFGLLSPFFFRISVCVMSDTLACFLLAFVLYLTILFYQSGRPAYLALIMFFSSLCLLTRYATAAPLTVLYFLLLVTRRKNPHSPAAYILWPAVIAAVIFLIGVFYLTHPFNHPLVHEISARNFFRSSFHSADGMENYALPNAVFMFSPFLHPGFIFAGIFLLLIYPVSELRRPEILFCLLPAVAYLLFLSFLPLQNTRLQTLVFPFVLLAYQPAFEKLLGMVKWKYALLCLIIIIQLGLTAKAMNPFYEMNRTERAIAGSLKAYANQFHYIYECGSDGIIQSYRVPMQPISLYGDTLHEVKDSSLLLIQTGRFENQWQGMLPERNYRFITKHAVLHLLKSFEGGWDLYAVGPGNHSISH